MKFESPDMVAGNIEKIGELFPGCITETRGKDGKLRKAINFDLLKQMLSADVVEGDEAYEFTWVGKKAAIAEANRPIRKTLRPCPEESVDWDTTENLYIEGDNLEVLKLLQESYLGKVKMIYIDPPYNTGNDFIYRDDFAMKSDEYEEQLGMFDDDTGDRLFKNTDSNGRFHSDWCSMILPRLLLARNLLTNDGVIFISIADEELENMLKIADDVFNRKNYVGTILWKKKTNGNNMGFLPPVHDYILCYAKNISSIIDMGYPVSSEFLQKTFSNPDNDPRGPWTTTDLSANHKGPYFAIKNPNTGEEFYPPDGRYWVFNETEVCKRIADGRIIFGKTGTTRPVQKVFAANRTFSRIRAESWWDDKGMNEDATAELKDLFGAAKLFSHPKPTKLIKHLLTIATDTDSVILDFFSGSSTTADAVMQLNAEDAGKRKYIMIQLEESCAADSPAKEAGYDNICELALERIRRAGKKVKLDTAGKAAINLFAAQNNPGLKEDLNDAFDRQFDKANTLDIGFRVLKLDDSNMEDVYYSSDEITQEALAEAEMNIKPDRTDLDLLFGCLLEWGLPLSLPYKSEEIEGCKVHTYNDGDLVACFDRNIPESVIRSIAKRRYDGRCALRAVFRDVSFSSSPEKINVEEVFKLLSPDTRVKVI
jgi:adenine-specific DNA-methyltransferase